MARRTDKTGKTGAGQLPAEIYKFSQSGSASYKGAEHGARPPNLSSTEQRLYDELLALARKLERRGAPGVYALVAAVADQVALLKRKDQDTVAMLARGLDGLRQIDANHTSRRLQTMRQAMADHDEIALTLILLVVSIGCLIGGFFPYSIFFLAAAAVWTLPALWDVMTRR